MWSRVFAGEVVFEVGECTGGGGFLGVRVDTAVNEFQIMFLLLL